jgi:hypothetical protein
VSAVIYAAIVLMWAVVLVPMWLRRHDAQTESRSVDRFSTAMRTLSRRSPATPGRRYVLMPKRSEGGPAVHVSGAAAPKPRQVTATRAAAPTAPPSAPVTPKPTVRPASRPARRPTSLVARRRRLLLGLLAVTFLTMVLAIAGIVSWPLQIVVDVILAAFVWHLRAQARRGAELARTRRSAAAAPVATRRPARPSVPVPATAPMAPAATAPLAVGAEDLVEADEADETWEPVPVPRPTYTMKPPAPAYEADPTYSPPVYEPAARAEDVLYERVDRAEEAIAQQVAEERETDLEEILERRWAVND